MDSNYFEAGYIESNYFFNFISASASIESSFASSFAVNKTASANAEFTATFSQSGTISHIEGADLFAFTNAAIAVQVDRLRDNNISASVAFSVATDASRTRNLSGDDSAEFSFTANTVLARSRDYASNQSAAFSLPDVPAVKTARTSSSVSSQFTQTAISNFTTRPQIALSSTVGLIAYSTISVRNTQVSQFNAVSIDTDTKQFGLGSAKFTNAYNSTDALIARSDYNILHDGTNFKIFTDQYNWTSSDGLAWTRESSSLGTNNNVRFANSRYFTHNGSNARYSTNGTTWANEAITNGSGGTVAIVFLNSNFHNIYIQTVSNTRRFRTNKTSALGSANWITDQEITNTGKTAAQGVTFTQIVDVNNFAVWASEFSGGSNFILRYNGTTTNSYTAPSGGLPQYIGYNGSNEFIYQSTTVVKYSTNTGTTFADLDIGAGNKLTGNAVYVNGRWFVPTTLGLYSGTTVTALSLADVNAKTPVAFGSSRYIAQEIFTSLNTVYVGNIRHSTDASSWQSLLVPQQDNLTPRLSYSRTGTDLVNFQTIDSWFYNRFYVAIRESSNRYLMFNANASSSLQVIVADGTNALVYQFLSEVGVVPQNQWNHIRISKDGTNIAVYINGTRKMQFTSSISALTGGTVELAGVAGETINTFYDEFRITDELLVNPNTSSFTVPAQRFSNTTETDLLLHFDTNFGDDSRFPIDPQAAISSVASLQASLTGPVKASATLVVSSTITAIGGNLEGADLEAFSDAAVTTVAQRTRDGQSQINVQSNVNALVGIVRQLNSAVAVSVSTSTNGNALLSGTSNLSTAFTISSSENRLRDNNIALNTSAQLNSNAIKNVNTGSNVSSQFTFTGIISHIEGADLFAFTNGALTAAGLVIRSGISNQTSAVIQTATALRIKQSSGDLSASHNLAGAVNLQANGSANFALSVSLVSIGTKFKGSAVALTSAFNTTNRYLEDGYIESGYYEQFETTAVKTARGTAAIQSVATLTVGITTSVFAVLTTQSSSSVIATVKKTTSVQIVNASVFAQAAVVSRIRSATATFTANTTLTAQGLKGGEISLVAFANASVNISTRVNRFASAGLNTTVVFVVNTQDSLSISGSSDLNVISTFTASARKNVVAQAQIQSAGFVVSVSVAQKIFLAQFSTVSTLTVSTVKVARATAGITSTSSVSAVVGVRRLATVAITSALTFVVAVRELRLDAIVYVIPAEGWSYRIEGETRLHTIISESRVKEIVGETRLDTINGESRIHII